MSNYPEATNINGYYFKDANGRELIASEGNTRQTQFNNLNSKLNNLIAQGLVPYAVDSTSAMINTKRIYVLKSTGKWYYYNEDTSSWTIGGDYQANNDAGALTAIAQSTGKVLDFSSIVWEVGGVDLNTHKLSTQTDRIRNKTWIHAKAGSVLRFTGVSDGYQFKLSCFKHNQKITPSYIDEPVAFSDNAEEYTLTKDCFIVITIKKGSTVEEEDIETLSDYMSTSSIYEVKEEYPVPSEYTNILEGVDSYSGYRWGGHGSWLSNHSDETAFAEIPVEAGTHIRLIADQWSSVYLNCCLVNKEGDESNVDYYSLYYTTQGGVAFEVPEGTAYALITCLTSITPYCRITKKLDSVQEGIRLIKDGAGAKLIAHRGLEYFAPEATVPAYTIAGEKGMWGCKLDICETADNKFVMSHDATVDRMFNGSGNIADMTLAELQALTVDAGNHIADYPNEKIVTLEEALTICKHYGMHPYIEFKSVFDKTSVASILEIIKKEGLLEQTLCQCSDGNRQYLVWLRELNKNIPIVCWKSTQQTITPYHWSEPLGNAVLSYSSWNTDYIDLSYISKDFGYPVCIAVADGSSALTKINTAINEHGCCLAVTDRVTPADITPNTYPTE